MKKLVGLKLRKLSANFLSTLPLAIIPTHLITLTFIAKIHHKMRSCTKKKTPIRRFWLPLFIPFLLITACSENTAPTSIKNTASVSVEKITPASAENSVPASITGYNHSKIEFIDGFSVNGAGGANLSPEGGGGNQSCCVTIPARWRPGLQAKIAWVYGSVASTGRSAPPPQEKMVAIPEYKTPGSVHVHFYDEHKVKIVISTCSIEHPFYPMSQAEILPWAARFSKEEALDSEKRGGAKHDC